MTRLLISIPINFVFKIGSRIFVHRVNVDYQYEMTSNDGADGKLISRTQDVNGANILTHIDNYSNPATFTYLLRVNPLGKRLTKCAIYLFHCFR